MKILAISLLALLLVGCSDQDASAPEQPLAEAAPPAVEASRPSLPDILNAQPTEVKARYPYRHPEETLEFLGITPGMAVVDIGYGVGPYSSFCAQNAADVTFLDIQEYQVKAKYKQYKEGIGKKSTRIIPISYPKMAPYRH